MCIVLGPDIPLYHYSRGKDYVSVYIHDASAEVNAFVGLYIDKHLKNIPEDNNSLVSVIDTVLRRLIVCGIIISRHTYLLDVKRMAELYEMDIGKEL